MHVSTARTKVRQPRRETSITSKLFSWRLINLRCCLFYCHLQIHVHAFMPREEPRLGGSEPMGGKHGSPLAASRSGRSRSQPPRRQTRASRTARDEQIPKVARQRAQPDDRKAASTTTGTFSFSSSPTPLLSLLSNPDLGVGNWQQVWDIPFIVRQTP